MTYMPFLTDDDGNVLTVDKPPMGQIRNLISPNWCDKCSWFTGSIKAEDEVLTSANGISWQSQNQYWIDMTHGRQTFEDMILTENPGQWTVTVTVDDVKATQDVDYTVDFPSGIVTFSESKAGKTVKATYWYASTGLFLVKPRDGKKLTIQRIEIQFDTNVILRDNMEYQAYGYVSEFAPELTQAPYNMQPDDLIPIGDHWVYKNARDYMSDSNGAWPIIPDFGGNEGRGAGHDTITLTWRYLSRSVFYSSSGMELRIGMSNNTPHGGKFATATVYGYEENE